MATPYDHDWQQFRLTILERDRHVCRLQLPGCTTHATHVDHIVPLSEGGARLDPNNTRASCAHCNLRRNAQRAAQLAQALVNLTRKTSTPSDNW